MDAGLSELGNMDTDWMSETETYVAEFGEERRSVIESALAFLDDLEARCGIRPHGIDRRIYLEELLTQSAAG